MKFASIHVVRHQVLPDDRLVHVYVDAHSVLTFAYRERYIHPALLRDLSELSRHMTRSGMFELDPSKLGAPPMFAGCMERFSATDWAPDQTLQARVQLATEKAGMVIEVLARDTLLSKDLAKEFNEALVPACGVLVPRLHL